MKEDTKQLALEVGSLVVAIAFCIGLICACWWSIDKVAYLIAGTFPVGMGM